MSSQFFDTGRLGLASHALIARAWPAVSGREAARGLGGGVQVLGLGCRSSVSGGWRLRRGLLRISYSTVLLPPMFPLADLALDLVGLTLIGCCYSMVLMLLVILICVYIDF